MGRVWINAAFSFWQEYQAEQALAALKRVLPVQVKVYRAGGLQTILARELVPGDVVQLEEGDRISADARLVSSQSFYVDVSVLTGESLPVFRHAEPVLTESIQPAEVANLIFAGSTVAAGRGTAVVHATGAQTEFGQVAHLTTSVKREPSTLEVQIAKIVQLITLLAVGMGVTVFLLSYLLIHMDVKESFIFGIGIIVANVPEGLLPTVSLALAIAVQRMARRNALVRRLSAVETLSATTVICTDKTGTLTKNEMTVCALWLPATSLIEVTGVGYAPQGEVRIPDGVAQWKVNLLLAGAALCSNAKLIHPDGSSQWQIGDPTEATLLVAALKAGLDLDVLQQRSPRLREVPFDSRRRMMTVVLNWQAAELWANQAPFLSITKGAPVEVAQRCRWVLQDAYPHAITPADREQIIAMNDQLASQGYRVLGIAARQGERDLLEQDVYSLEQELIFIGLVAMLDPPRLEVAEAIARCHQAGIAVTMVTGDYGLTAEAIARRIDLVNHHKAKVVTGEQMGYLSDAQLHQVLQHHPVGLIFARMAPEQKLRLVQAYKVLGHVVAVTGDGVNDAPALRAAHIGLAMGVSGTDVAREAADIVLIDDNFATIVSAIEQGRAVYQNIRKFMTYILSSNVPEIVPFLMMVGLKIPPALTILQILAIDLGTDMVPALALGAELPETEVMQQPPRPKQKPLLDSWLLVRAYLFLGIIEAMAGMTGFFLVWWSHGYSIADLQQVTPEILAHTADPAVTTIYRQATTMTLAAIVACQIGNIFACRSDRTSIFKTGWFSNRLVWVGIAVELVLLLAIIRIAPLSHIFNTSSLPLWQWLVLLACPPLILLAEEMRKWMIRETAIVKS